MGNIRERIRDERKIAKISPDAFRANTPNDPDQCHYS